MGVAQCIGGAVWCGNWVRRGCAGGLASQGVSKRCGVFGRVCLDSWQLSGPTVHAYQGVVVSCRIDTDMIYRKCTATYINIH